MYCIGFECFITTVMIAHSIRIFPQKFIEYLWNWKFCQSIQSEDVAQAVSKQFVEEANWT